MAAQGTVDNTPLFRQLDEYKWDDDAEFQGGLRAILGSAENEQQVEHLTLRAKCYYYARKAGIPVDFDGYKAWVESCRTNGTAANTQAPADTSGGMADAPKPASFAEICDMIAEGKPIPGIKDIPDTILEGQASESNTARRKKPWEKTAGEEEAKPSWMT
ncbi:uncharacterized protein MYCFIDRAFT_150657 [Pseudocercospora fijiensis CIRAD86]|uniref:Uncharacterized protein n=1 Tax=Pseudocercospora fijiensis (strain CIRAD86) TaxID=383855 RepID=M3ALX4_PSEFD|nr:uncharacterized protein MYCFIDRAFT_150657 [Pseudocercospora fijiensis CIRAD86]EME85596.1 hypothetical protein MYCFIDRAFT_150657 [Pseudocercospora fijiensis CIRAD86]